MPVIATERYDSIFLVYPSFNEQHCNGACLMDEEPLATSCRWEGRLGSLGECPFRGI